MRATRRLGALYRSRLVSPSTAFIGEIRHRQCVERVMFRPLRDACLPRGEPSPELTDAVQFTDIVPFWNLFGLIFPVTFTLRPFLAKQDHSAAG